LIMCICSSMFLCLTVEFDDKVCNGYRDIRYDSVYLTCSKKLTVVSRDGHVVKMGCGWR